MFGPVSQTRAHVAVVIASGVTAMLANQIHKMAIAEIETKNSIARDKLFTETWDRAWQDAKANYNRHPHLYCDICIANMNNPS